MLSISVSNYPSDMHTLPLFINKLHKVYKEKMDKIVCDSVYESEENYVYLEKLNLRAYIKSMNYEISKTRKYKKKQGFRNIYSTIKNMVDIKQKKVSFL